MYPTNGPVVVKFVLFAQTNLVVVWLEPESLSFRPQLSHHDSYYYLVMVALAVMMMMMMVRSRTKPAPTTTAPYDPSPPTPTAPCAATGGGDAAAAGAVSTALAIAAPIRATAASDLENNLPYHLVVVATHLLASAWFPVHSGTECSIAARLPVGMRVPIGGSGPDSTGAPSFRPVPRLDVNCGATRCPGQC